LIEVKQNGSLLMSFFYDGDGQRVKSTLIGSPANTTTYYIGNHTEYETQALITTLRRYFYAGSTRVAMRVVDGATNPTYWLLNDQLGSTAITADANGTKTAELRFKAWGESRYTYGSTPTTYRYTGQREQSQLSIYFYGARWYDDELSRFLQPDTVIPSPSDSQAWDRFAYALNNPLSYSDPTGHLPTNPPNLAVQIARIGVAVWDVLTVAPVKDDRAPNPTSQDMTGWLVDRINENAHAPVTQNMHENWTSGDPSRMKNALKTWTSMVREDGVWDYKVDIGKAKLEGEITLGGLQLSSQAVANIHFGAVGRAAGFPENVLEAGAGIAQLMTGVSRREWGNIGPASSYFDDPFDNRCIKLGSWLYDNYGRGFGSLRRGDYTLAMRRYIRLHGDLGKPLPRK
jgi:RHS repeat-associated protein